MLRDARVLDTREPVPSQDLIVARHDQLSALSHAIETFLQSDLGGHAFVTGPSGVGKTMLARFLQKKLQQEYLDVDTAYVDCWRDHSTFGALSTLLGGVGRTVRLDERGTPHNQLWRQLDGDVTNPYVVVLDEVDQLDDVDVLLRLYEMADVFPICICNDQDAIFERAGQRGRSRLSGGDRILMPLYDTDELTAILTERAEHGLQPGSIEDAVLEAIAVRADGDARVAIEALQTGARMAMDQGATMIREAYVEDAVADARDRVRQRSISSLKKSQRVVLEVLGGIGEPAAMGELHDRFCDRYESCSRQTLRRYLTKLERYGHVDFEGEKRGRRYRLVT